MKKLLGEIALYPVLLLMRMVVGLLAGVVLMISVIQWLKK